MQNCFREYPEVYGSELDSDADDDDEAVAADLGAPADGTPTSPAPASAASPAAEVEAEAAAPKAEEASSTKHKLSGDKTDGKLALVPATYKPDAQKEQ
jgi:intermembrane space import and assembly protein 40